jgi:hypothetical protein
MNIKDDIKWMIIHYNLYLKLKKSGDKNAQKGYIARSR